MHENVHAVAYSNKPFAPCHSVLKGTNILSVELLYLYIYIYRMNIILFFGHNTVIPMYCIIAIAMIHSIAIERMSPASFFLPRAID